MPLNHGLQTKKPDEMTSKFPRSFDTKMRDNLISKVRGKGRNVLVGGSEFSLRCVMVDSAKRVLVIWTGGSGRVRLSIDDLKNSACFNVSDSKYTVQNARNLHASILVWERQTKIPAVLTVRIPGWVRDIRGNGVYVGDAVFTDVEVQKVQKLEDALDALGFIGDVR